MLSLVTHDSAVFKEHGNHEKLLEESNHKSEKQAVEVLEQRRASEIFELKRIHKRLVPPPEI